MIEAYLETGRLRTFYREAGVGTPLILLHGGWMTGRMNWEHHQADLARYFRVIAPDNRGHGRTHNPAGQFDSYRDHAEDVIAFIEALDLEVPPIVMGHSSGAVISLLVSALRPQLLARQVLIAIHPHIGTSPHWEAGMRSAFATRDHRQPPSSWGYALANPVNTFALWQAHRATGWYRLLRQVWPIWIQKIAVDYDAITIPTFIVGGDRDEFGTAEEMADLQRRIRGSQLDILPGEDHMFVVDHPCALQRSVWSFLMAGR